MFFFLVVNTTTNKLNGYKTNHSIGKSNLHSQLITLLKCLFINLEFCADYMELIGQYDKVHSIIIIMEF